MPAAPRIFSLPSRPFAIPSVPAQDLRTTSEPTSEPASQPPLRLAPVAPNGQSLPPPRSVLQAKRAAALFRGPDGPRGERAKGPGTGLPISLKLGVEGLSGLSMDDVRVHYNSPAPRSLNALAFTRGTEVHVAPGQERHLAHEAWHVVQQKEGRVRPTIRLGEIGANADPALEREAEAMGSRAGSGAQEGRPPVQPSRTPAGPPAGSGTVQRFPVTAQWGPANNFRGGSWMEAEVGADDEWVYGSKPKANTPTIIGKVGKIVGGKRRYIAGHLLNDNMGGLGENKNLTVLSSDANKRHTGIEGRVKKLGIKAGQINRGSTTHGDPNYDHGVRYRVDVMDPAPAGVPPHDKSEKSLAAGLTITIDPIRKDQYGFVSPWPEEAGSALVNHVVNNVPPYPAAPKKGNANPLQRKIILAVKGLAEPQGSRLGDIHGHINANKAAGAADVKKISVALALKNGETKQLWKKHQGKYKLIL
jgi:hypothetical protein